VGAVKSPHLLMFNERRIVMIPDTYKSKQGFTLIELMIVIFIVGILSAVAIPLMRGRVDASKWSEGKSMAGSIRSSIRVLYADLGPKYDYTTVTTLAQLGFADSDLDGKYFKHGDFTFAITNNDPLEYVITITTNNATSPEAPKSPGGMTLDQNGDFIEIP
jgi:prepilin-type N-terminal cleavage/methylation domain-containing protein